MHFKKSQSVSIFTLRSRIRQYCAIILDEGHIYENMTTTHFLINKKSLRLKENLQIKSNQEIVNELTSYFRKNFY